MGAGFVRGAQLGLDHDDQQLSGPALAASALTQGRPADGAVTRRTLLRGTWRERLHLGWRVWGRGDPAWVSPSCKSWVHAPATGTPGSHVASHRVSSLFSQGPSISASLPSLEDGAANLSLVVLPFDSCEPLQQVVCLQPLSTPSGHLST